MGVTWPRVGRAFVRTEVSRRRIEIHRGTIFVRCQPSSPCSTTGKLHLLLFPFFSLFLFLFVSCLVQLFEQVMTIAAGYKILLNRIDCDTRG